MVCWFGLSIERISKEPSVPYKVNDPDAVSYTHLDVYKRQVEPSVQDPLLQQRGELA